MLSRIRLITFNSAITIGNGRRRYGVSIRLIKARSIIAGHSAPIGLWTRRLSGGHPEGVAHARTHAHTKPGRIFCHNVPHRLQHCTGARCDYGHAGHWQVANMLACRVPCTLSNSSYSPYKMLTNNFIHHCR